MNGLDTPGASLTSVFPALRFQGRRQDDLENIPRKSWPTLLRLTDQAQLTLPLGIRCRARLPELVRARIDHNLACNEKRHAAARATQREIADRLQSGGLEFLVLKGLSQSPWYNDNPRRRSQYDIDFYCPEGSLAGASETLRTLGYEPAGTGDTRTDHLPVMIRKTGWKWRDDYYDPEMPLSVELHFRFWDPETEGFDIARLDRFWQRRIVRDVDGMRMPTLTPADGLSYTAMHLVRHLLRGDLKPGHVYELAHFLQRSAEESAFWSDWRDSGLPSCRVVEGIAFRLASDWFACDLNPVAREAVERLPNSVKRWFDLFAFSPASGRPNKNELWLHLCLVESPSARRRIALRRIFPTSRARVVAEAHVPVLRGGIGLRMRRLVFAASFMTRRALFHAGTLMPMVYSGLKWLRARES